MEWNNFTSTPSLSRSPVFKKKKKNVIKVCRQFHQLRSGTSSNVKTRKAAILTAGLFTSKAPAVRRHWSASCSLHNFQHRPAADWLASGGKKINKQERVKVANHLFILFFCSLPRKSSSQSGGLYLQTLQKYQYGFRSLPEARSSAN